MLLCDMMQALRMFAPGGVHGDGIMARDAVQKSGAITMCVEALGNADNTKVLFAILQATRALAVVPVHAQQMSKAGLLEAGIAVLASDMQGEAAAEAVSLLCSVLERNASAAAELGSWQTLSVLKDCLVKILTEGYSLADRTMRNDILVVCIEY